MVKKIQRSTDEVIVLSLCVLFMVGLALFALIRFQRGEVGIAVLEALVFTGCLVIGAYVYRTHDLRYAGPALGILSLAGTVMLVVLGGPDERDFLYPTSVVAFFLIPPVMALILSTLALVAVSVFVVPEIAVFAYGKYLLTVSGCMLFAYIFSRERNRQRDTLISLSTLDPLTGVGNRRAFDEEIEAFMRLRERHSLRVTLMLIDLDNFKLVNDTLGHVGGDGLLRDVATQIAARMRAGDHVYRYGGDEFAVLAQGEGVRILAEDLQNKVSALARKHQSPVSVSIGVALLRQEDDSAEWIKRADEALYQAKSSGRNQVKLA